MKILILNKIDCNLFEGEYDKHLLLIKQFYLMVHNFKELIILQKKMYIFAKGLKIKLFIIKFIMI
jgi:hypothetical protein